ncbi:uncharacterized protein [Malus domestica]|uniref:uncharacterized protein isoform X3 n=1 Tax=Malus domestica TaxID=3750 RepID=UPI000498AFA8
MTSFKKLDHRQSTMTLVERSKMLAAKVGKIQKAKIRHRTESGVEPQFLVLLLVLSSCGESDTAKADTGIREKGGKALILQKCWDSFPDAIVPFEIFFITDKL